MLSSNIDQQIIFNKLSELSENKNPVGFVKLFDLTKKKPNLILEKPNLVTGLGREYVGQKIITHSTQPPQPYPQLSLTELPTGIANWRNHEITHYGFGSGGVNIFGTDDYELTGPMICDRSLYRPITYQNPSFLDGPVHIDEGDEKRLSTQSVKPINFGYNEYEYQLKEYEQSHPNPNCQYFVQFKMLLYKEVGEFGCLHPSEEIQVSEAGLFITNTTDTDNPDPRLFAHICFAPKFMNLEGLYALEWYILC